MINNKKSLRGGVYKRALKKRIIGGVNNFTPEILATFPLDEGKRGGFLCVKF
jgi:hypothetical protein